MLIDEAEITLKGGYGGAGIVSFGAKEKSGPDGGNGGSGGDIYLKASSDITLLNQFSQKILFIAGSGMHGGKSRSTGKDGKNLEILVPVGTTLIDLATNEIIADFIDVGQTELICKGGLGGRGNFEFRSARRTTPEYAQPGKAGEERRVKVILKLIANFGLIGKPNAGKSSLLNELTRANAKTASYEFTTLFPNLGVLGGKIIADIPGLIEGAAEGRGLGINFLKHIEKVSTLLHCISTESTNPLKDYKTVRKEMGKYNKSLLQKPEIILITKSDLVDKKALLKIKKGFDKKAKILEVSIHDWDSLEKLKSIL